MIPVVCRLLRDRAAEQGNELALSSAGGSALSFGMWERRANMAARGMLAQGVNSGDSVLLLFSNIEWTSYAVAYVAVQKVGAVAVPLLLNDDPMEILRIARHCVAKLAVCDGADVDTGVLRIVTVDSLEHGCSAETVATSVSPEGLSELIYSRGIVEWPRASSFTQTAVQLQFEQNRNSEGPRSSLVHTFAVGTRSGQRALRYCLLPDNGPAIFTSAVQPGPLRDLIRSEGDLRLGLTSAAAQVVVDSKLFLADVYLHVREVLVAGPPAGAKLLWKLAHIFQQASVAVLDAVGHAGVPGATLSYDRNHPGAVGEICNGMEVRIVGRSAGPVTSGEVGEVLVRCVEPSVGHPYKLPQHVRGETSPEETSPEETSLPAPWRAVPCCGYTSDTGMLYVVVSARDVIKAPDDVTLFALDVEYTLREHPRVGDAAVFQARLSGQPGELTAAIVMSGSTTAFRSQELRELGELVRSRLGQTAVPRVIFMKDIPRRADGSLRRGELALRMGLIKRPRMLVSPRDETETVILSAWQRVLDREDISTDDDFFDLDGDELASAQMLALIEDAFEVELHSGTLAQFSTVAEIAYHIRTILDGTSTPPTPARYAPLAHTSQAGFLWREQCSPGSGNAPPLIYSVGGPFDSHIVSRALADVAQRQGALRTTFDRVNGRVVQVVADLEPHPLQVIDLTDDSIARQQATIRNAIAAAGLTPIDLVCGPVFMPTLFQTRPDTHVLLIPRHHALWDHWSIGVFERELSRALSAGLNGSLSRSNPVPQQFVDFAKTSRRKAVGLSANADFRYWRDKLAGAPLSVQLPIDVPTNNARTTKHDADPVRRQLSSTLTEAVRDLSLLHRTTPFLTMAAALQVLISRYTGQSDILSGLAVANRDSPAYEDTIGCFTKLIPLRIDLSDDPTFIVLMTRLRGTFLEGFEHKDLPYDTVLRDILGPQAVVHGLTPQVSVMLQGLTEYGGASPLLPEGILRLDHAVGTVPLPHFNASEQVAPGQEPRRSPLSRWGDGLYLGTVFIMSIIDAQGDLTIAAEGLFDTPSVERLLRNYETVLIDLIADPEQSVSNASLLSAEEQQDLSHRWSVPCTGPIRIFDSSTCNLRVCILDSRRKLCPIGVVGLLHVDASDLVDTDASYGGIKLADPFSASLVFPNWEGLLVASDQRARYLPYGEVEVMGKVADHISFRGFDVDVGRMTMALAQCMLPREAIIAVGCVDGEQGGGFAIYVVDDENEAPTLVDIRGRLAAEIPGYMIPSDLRVVDRLALLPPGIRLWPIQLTGRGENRGVGDGRSGSASPVASLLSSLWAGFVGVASIGMDENYWLSFPFINAAREACFSIPGFTMRHIIRSRTIRMLASDYAQEGARTRDS